MKEWRIEMAKKSLTRRGLKIIVVGCGKVGETLTDQTKIPLKSMT